MSCFTTFIYSHVQYKTLNSLPPPPSIKVRITCLTEVHIYPLINVQDSPTTSERVTCQVSKAHECGYVYVSLYFSCVHGADVVPLRGTQSTCTGIIQTASPRHWKKSQRKKRQRRKRHRRKRQLTIRLLLYSYLLLYCCTRLLKRKKRHRRKRQLTIRLLLYSYLLFYCCTRLLNVRY